MNTLIISPTYNESKNIANLIEHVFTLDENYHLLIVDDNSPDGTAVLVEKLQQRYKNLHLEKKFGTMARQVRLFFCLPGVHRVPLEVLPACLCIPS